jgi:acyl-CoA thioester hydrolase
VFTQKFQTGFSDTDALGHINNSKFPIWFENARTPLFKIFTPDLKPENWKLILVKMNYEFLRQTFYGIDLEVSTYISRVGNSSFGVLQEAWQNGEMVVQAETTMVYFDYLNQKSINLPESMKNELSKHLKMSP